MPLTSFCGVNLPQITLINLKKQVSLLEKNSQRSLYFLYSEFLIRASRNLSYRKVLNKASITVIDGKGLEWTNQVLSNPNTKKLNLFLKAVINIFTGIWVILLNQKLAETNNEVILGRNFIYDLFKIANQNKYKIAIIGGNKVLEDNLKKKFPNASFNVWQTDSSSNLMRDIPKNSNNLGVKLNDYTKRHSFLSQENLFTEFPELVDSINFLKKTEWDYIFVTIGGASGKQEFFCDYIQKVSQEDSKIKFRLITGIGAAFDHLGGNNKQRQTPKLLERLGLEWFFRIITNPKRAIRILDSVITLWWLTSKEG